MDKKDYSYIATLVQRAQANDSEAFAELYALSYQKQYYYALHYLKDEHLAQDALQEVYILVLKNLHKLKNRELFISWLNQINFRVCFDFKKKMQKESFQLNDLILEDSHDEHMDHNPEEMVLFYDEQNHIKTALERLPVKQKQMIMMRYFNDLSLKDIADLTNCSLSTVKRQLSAGISLLKEELEKGGASDHEQ